MGNFVKAVQDGSVPGPLRRQFRKKDWRAKFSELGSDEDDRRLHEMGHLIFEKAQAIRGQLRITLAENISASTKLRALVALSNQNMILVRRKAEVSMTEVAGSIERPLVTDLAGVKIDLPVGAGYTVDEINQSVVDGVEVPIRVILDANSDLSGAPRFGSLDWRDVAVDFNLGNFYSFLEGLWDDCLWNGYVHEDRGRVLKFAPKETFWEELKSASLARADNLAMQFFGIWGAHADQLKRAGGVLRSNVKHVSEVIREGRRQVVRFADPGEHESVAEYLDAARAYASEPYYEGLIREPQTLLGGGSLNDLLSGWAVASSVSRALHRRVVQAERSIGASQIGWLPECAPVIERAALIQGVEGGARLTYKVSSAVVEFLTFRGKPGQELWAQPFVPVGSSTLGPIFGAAEHANVRRLIDVWMRQLDIDMGRRGPAFERYVRQELKELASESSLRNSAECLLDAFVFRPSAGRSEEMDVVMRVGDAILVGEAKCSVVPTEAKQFAMHRRLIVEAVEQVKRKVASATCAPVEFRAQLRAKGIDVPEVFRVIPAVILSAAVNTGMSVNEVAVVDLYVFRTFFSGELVDLASLSSEGGMQTVSKRLLYGDAGEASARLEGLLRSPAQMEAFVSGLSSRWVPIPQIGEGDWAAEYFCLECVPRPVGSGSQVGVKRGSDSE